MNKVTLSLVALATIGGTAQAQTAMTQEEKADAIAQKKAAIEEIRKNLNDATTTVNGCVDVSSKYLTQLSSIAKELNVIYEDDTDLEITKEECDNFNLYITNITSEAITAQKPYTAKKELTAKYNVLKALLDGKLAIANKTEYSAVGPQIAKALNDLKVPAILEKINAYDLTKQDIVNDQTAIEGEINTATASVNKILKDEQTLKDLEKAAADNEAAHEAVVNAYTVAKTNYDKQLASALDALPSDNYKDWQEEVIADLNEQYRIITSAKNEDAKDYEAGTAATNYLARVNAINAAAGQIATLVSNKVAEKNQQEVAYTAAIGDVKALQDKLDAIKKQLSDRKLTDCDAAIADVQTLIDALSADIETQYKAHKINGYAYAGDKTAIVKATNGISDGKEHRYDAIIDNYDAYSMLSDKIVDAQKELDDAVTKAKKASKDGKYAPADYFAATQQKAQTAIDDVTTAIKKAYDSKTAVNYMYYGFSEGNIKITSTQSTYISNTEEALTAYETIQTKVNAQNKLLAELAETMNEDPKVTIDGSCNGKSYQTRYDELVAEVKTITDGLAKAEKLKDKEHLDAINAAAAKTVSTDVQTLIDSYADNKKAFDLNNATATAQIYLDKAAELIESDKKTLAGITGDFGNQAETISESKTKIAEEIANVETEYTKAKEEYLSAAEDKKMEAAAKAVETLSIINDKLEKLAPEVKALNDQATVAIENKKAYDETIALTTADSKAKKALEELKIYATDNTYGTAETYYHAEADKLITELSNVAKEIEDAYTALKCKEMQEELTKKVNDIIAKGDNLRAGVVPNKLAHGNQTAATATLLESWQAAYDVISSGDLSDEAKNYLSELAGEREKITALNKVIEDAFGKGQSKEKNDEIEATINDITDVIADIQQKSKDNYDANVAATNKAEHDKFIATIGTTKTQFSQAVETLNKFAAIKNEASKTALENLVDTHDKIYAYADMIRQLSSKELTDYTSHSTATYGDESSIFNSDEYCTTASEYSNGINKLLKAYQDEVNKVAYANFKSVVANAEANLKEKQDIVKDYLYKGHDKAFDDVADVIAKAKTAGGTATDGIPEDPMYAVHVDEWAVTLETNLDDMLNADLLKACDAEKAFLVDAITTLHAEETTEIKKLTLSESDMESYLANVDELKKVVDEIAEVYDQTPESVKAIRSAYDNYFDTDKKHSVAYNQAIKKSQKSEANIQAYNSIITYLDAAQSDFDKVTADIKKLIVGHESATGVVSVEMNNLQEVINEYRRYALDWLNTGACDKNVEIIKSVFVNDGCTFETYLENIQETAIDTEIQELAIKTDEVKEQYNQVAKTDFDKVAEYDAKIEALYNTLLINSRNPESTDKTEAEGAKASIEWRWKNEKLTSDKALSELEAHEAKVAALLQELNSLDKGNTRVAESIDAVNKKIAEVDEGIKKAEEWANYNEAIEFEFGEMVETLRQKLTDIQSDFEAKKGTILFHENGLQNDLATLNAAVESATDKSGDFFALYDKHVKNDAAKATLDEQVMALETLASETSEKIAAFKYHNDAEDANLETWMESINEIKKDVTKSYEDVDLVANTKIYAERISNLKNKIILAEKYASWYDADLNIWHYKDGLWGMLNTTIRPIIDGSNYSAERKEKLENEYSRILNAIYAIDYYNYAAYLYGNVWADINGNKFYDEDGIEICVTVDYMSEVYPEVVNRIAELQADVEQLKSDAETTSYIVGDADNDKEVTVNDYSTVRGFILNNVAFEDVSEAQRYAADFDGDGKFTVADLNSVSNVIFGVETPTPVLRARVRAVASDNEILMTKQAEEVSVFGKTVKVAVSLNNTNAFTAGQFDIQLPEGMSISGNELTERSNGHEIFVNEIGDGIYRVVVATIDNNAFNGNNGDLVYFNVEVGNNVADGSIQLSNAIFADAQGRAYSLGDIDGTNATGIDSINAATAKERVYSIGGQIMKTVKKGINIIVGENGEAKKVMNK